MQYKKKLFVHVSTAMLAIVFSVSIATYLYETIHIEEHIQEKVIKISTLLSQEYMHLHKQKSQNMLMKKIKDPEFAIEDKNIHLFNISDENGNVIIDRISTEYEKIQIQIEKYKHNWIIKDSANTKIIFIHNPETEKYYVDIVMSLKIIDNKNEIVHSLYDATNDINNINSKLYKNIVAVAVIGILLFLAVYPTVLALQNGLLAKTKALSKTNIEILNLLGSVIAKRDSDTYVHNHRVTLYALTLGEKLGLSKDNLRALIKGAFLHDIGKIGIRDNILLKPGKLTYDEFEIMKKHVNLGKDIISYSEQLEDAKNIVYFHHEKYDGSGYPEGLVGNEIPLNARIFALADVFDALTSKRPYKEAFSYQKTYEIMQNSSGSHFDPELLKLFFETIPNLFVKINAYEDDEQVKNLLDDKIFTYISES